LQGILILTLICPVIATTDNKVNTAMCTVLLHNQADNVTLAHRLWANLNVCLSLHNLYIQTLQLLKKPGVELLSPRERSIIIGGAAVVPCEGRLFDFGVGSGAKSVVLVE
jgi:hypothetical protein